jgi:ectoine hydroxylase-related dioxygenase (phytanoyl-CoA dioxygenase family)
MHPFIDSTDLIDDSQALRKQMRKDGYLFLRGVLPTDEVLTVRRKALEFCREAGWLVEGSELMDGLTDHAPVQEGAEEWQPVYAKLQAVEEFHRLKLGAGIRRIIENLFDEPVFALPMTISRVAFPNDNDNGTQPHQDWLYVGGSIETISCWAPLGDVPEEVGGLRILAGSHKAGFLKPHPAPGPGGNAIDVDPDLEWHQSGYMAGDVLLFNALTVHAAAENHTEDRLRVSIDFRYTGESDTVTESWMKPHYHWLGDQFSWDALDKDWRDSPTARYWERIPKIKTQQHQPMVN